MADSDYLKTSSNFSKTQQVGKSVVASDQGVVAAQHHLAAAVGAEILSQGGNAIDAAIATSFMLGVVEPWMSGPGGGGAMVIYRADQQRTAVIDCNMRASSRLNPADYPLVPGIADDLFPWGRVRDDRNLKGPFSIAVPGLVDGMGLAHKNHATMDWKALLEPAIAMAKLGPRVDWYTSLMTAACVTDLAADPMAASVFLNNGNVRAAPWTALSEDRLDMSQMAKTLHVLAEDGARAFYEGDLGRAIAQEVGDAGGPLCFDDLQAYRAREIEPLIYRHGTTELRLTPELTAGSTMQVALEAMALAPHAAERGAPDAEDLVAIAKAIHAAQDGRLQTMGDVDGGRTQTCTTSFSVVDKWGNMAVVTQTLLSVFGSKVMLPGSGLLMNNGILWFDTEPGKPNSLGPDKRCLTNICPLIGVQDDRMFGLGASGGRKIMSAVLQLTSFLSDFGMDLEQAFHQARIDCSIDGQVIMDEAYPPDFAGAMSEYFQVTRAKRTVYPYSFACPSGVLRQGNTNYGMTEISSPWGDAIAASGN